MSIYTHPFLNAYRFYSDPKTVPLLPRRLHYAYAKRNLSAGTLISHAIGSAELYGLVEPLNPNKVPITSLESSVTLTTALTKDQALTPSHLT